MRANASRAQGASPRARVFPVDYGDKLPPSAWYILAPPRLVHSCAAAPVHICAAVEPWPFFVLCLAQPYLPTTVNHLAEKPPFRDMGANAKP